MGYCNRKCAYHTRVYPCRVGYQIVVIMNRVVWFLGYFIYLYSMVLIFSSAFAIFRATTWYELYIRNFTKKTDP